jgi:hypothetical protein
VLDFLSHDLVATYVVFRGSVLDVSVFAGLKRSRIRQVPNKLVVACIMMLVFLFPMTYYIKFSVNAVV